MEYKFFIEFLGGLVLVFAHFFTDANPYAMGIITFSVYMIGQPANATNFSPLISAVSYLLGRESRMETVYAIMSQFLAAVLVLVTFQPLKVFMDQA
jgi:hypothetical protein